MNIQEFSDSMGNGILKNAIKLDEKGIPFVDMNEARLLWMNNLRGLRNYKLSLLDIDSIRALENKDDIALAPILVKKQILRDMPLNYDLSQCNDWKVLLTMFPSYVL